jgi:hypothetical protein
MKNEIIIIVISIFLVLSFSFLFFNSQRDITGFVSLGINDSDVIGNQTNSTAVTKEIAITAINESERIIKEMQKNNFSVVYMNDILAEARRILEQVDYAEILKNESSSEDEKTRARIALSLVNWRNIGYADIIIHTEKIAMMREQAFNLYDSIAAINKSIEKYKQEGVEMSSSENLLKETNTAFYEERYDDCEESLAELRDLIETQKTQTTIFMRLGKGGKTLFQRYWLPVLLFLISSSLIGFFSYRKINKTILRNKINQLRTQERVLMDLMKRIQKERFEENKISGFVYNTKLKKYQEKLNEIKEKLPVLDSVLKKEEEKKFLQFFNFKK